MKISEIRAELTEKFKSAETDSPSVEASLILMNVFGIDKTKLLISDDDVSVNHQTIIYEMADRRCKGEPIQYIIGEAEFMSLMFDVNKDVLIPRADTEVLVETLLEYISDNESVSAVDVGCGSGCIGVSLLHYRKNLSLTAIDISENAIAVAKRNAEKNGVADRMSFFCLDITKETPVGEYDFVVSNPPYIRSDVIPILDVDVRKFEPRTALDGGEDGLIFYRIIAEKIKPKKGGMTAFEIGYDQGKQVAAILEDNGYTDIKIIKDIECRDRVVTGKL